MASCPPTRCTAFVGSRRIASGDLGEVALAIREALADGADAPVLVFDEATSHPIEFDLRGRPDEVVRRLADRAPAEPPRRGPGRPRLGVVSREVTLLPRHWDWLGDQPGGASVALRKLVDEARRTNEAKDQIRRAQEAAYRFMSAMAGDAPGFEEAARALFAADAVRFALQTEPWPVDVRDHARTLAAPALAHPPVTGL